MNTAVAILLSIGFSCFLRLLTTIYKYYGVKRKGYKLKKLNFLSILGLSGIDSLKEFVKVILPIYGIFNELKNIVEYEQSHDKYLKDMRDKGIVISKYHVVEKDNSKIVHLPTLKPVKSKIKELRDYREHIINTQNNTPVKTLSIKKHRNCR